MKKVLIVDDDKALLEALQLGVEMRGYEVITISDGAEVVGVVEKFMPDLILLDVLLSGYDGRDIAKSLKNNKNTKSVPVIMLSASAKVDEIASEVGAAGFLTKPFELSDLWSTLERYCFCQP